MADATYLNNVEVKRIFKSNAPCVLGDAEEMLKYYRDRLMILAAMSPMTVEEGNGPIAWDFYVRREVNDIIEAMREEERDAWMAEYIIQFPEDCEDPYEKSDANS